MREQPEGNKAAMKAGTTTSASGTPKSLLEVEKEHIVLVLRYTKGDTVRAAEILGISRKNLWEKRKKYDLDKLVG